jgi:hypothetical protein
MEAFRGFAIDDSIDVCWAHGCNRNAKTRRRIRLRRFTRLTNGFSKRVENLAHAVSLHYMHYNFARPPQTLTKKYGKPTTPAMAAGVADHVWSV